MNVMINNPELAKLCYRLGDAAEIFAMVKGPISSSSYRSGPDAAYAIMECRSLIEQGILTDSKKLELVRIFAPTGDWDDVVGDNTIANEIFSLLESLF